MEVKTMLEGKYLKQGNKLFAESGACSLYVRTRKITSYAKPRDFLIFDGKSTDNRAITNTPYISSLYPLVKGQYTLDYKGTNYLMRENEKDVFVISKSE